MRRKPRNCRSTKRLACRFGVRTRTGAARLTKPDGYAKEFGPDNKA